MSSRRAAWVLAVLAVPWWGCKGNVNENNPTVAVTDRVSLSSSGMQGNLPSLFPSISADGRFVAFSSRATNFVAASTGGFEHVYVRDLLTGTTTLVSATPAGAPGNGNSSRPSISDNGQWIAFQSVADDLLGPGGDTNFTSDIFVRDLLAGTTIRVSVITTSGAESAGSSTGGVISGDGAFVAFESDATDLTADTYAPGSFNVFRHPRSATGTTDLISLTTAAVAATFATTPSISRDGGVIAFVAFDTDLTTPGTGGFQHVFVTPVGGTTELVSADSLGNEGLGSSDRPSISADGMLVAFESDAPNLAPDTNGAIVDIFVRSRTGGGTTALVSINDDGLQGTGNCRAAVISGDGRYVAYVSSSTNLVPGDGNNFNDLFWRDRLGGVTRRISVRTYGAEANGETGLLDRPSMTTDGRFVAYSSAAFNLVSNDGNGVDDVFIHGPIY